MLEGLKSRYAVASVNYRLSREALFPAAINDVKAAIRFLRANAKKYNLNPGKFAVWGGSAGGNLSALAAVSGGVNELYDPTLGNAAVSDKVQAAVDWFGPIYFSTMDAEFAALGTSGQMGATNAINSAESKYLGKLVGTQEAQPLVETASPLTYISKDAPPMYIQHGTKDRNIPITQSINFSKKLAEVIGKEKVTFEAIEGAGHGGPQFNSPENAAKIIEFLNKTLKPGQVEMEAPPADWIDPETTPPVDTLYKLYDTPARGAGTKGSYLIYLPPSYKTSDAKRFPVIYWLHGGFGYQKHGKIAIEPFAAAMKSGKMPETIIVVPQAIPSGWYANSKDGARPVEDVIIKNLVPHIDSTYRTIRSGRARGIEGSSMGGYGALRLTLKFPDIFGVSSSVGPSIKELLAEEPEMRTGDTFFGDQGYYESTGPWGIAKQNTQSIVAASPVIRILGGSKDDLEPTITKFSQLLTTLKINHTFFEVQNAGHDYPDILGKFPGDVYQFWKDAFTGL